MERTSPDAGTVRWKHDRAGELRYRQDQGQAAQGRVWFQTYDFAGRPLVEGEGPATFGGLDPDQEGQVERTHTFTHWTSSDCHD